MPSDSHPLQAGGSLHQMPPNRAYRQQASMALLVLCSLTVGLMDGRLVNYYAPDYSLFLRSFSATTTGTAETGEAHGAVTAFAAIPATAIPVAAANVSTTADVYPRLYKKPANRPLKGPNYNPYWLLVSKAHGLAITFVPKVMCSSLRAAITTANCRVNVNNATTTTAAAASILGAAATINATATADATTGLLPPPGNPRCAEARKNPSLKTLPLQNYTTAVMIRDPFERAYSAYSNAANNAHISIGKCPHVKTVDCTFEEWVDELAADPTRAFQNEHFRPQVSIIQMSSLHYHYRLRMSSPVDRAFLWDRLLHTHELVANGSSKSQTPPLPHAATTTTTDGGSSPSESPPLAAATTVREKFDAIPPRTIDKLARLYHADLQLWKTFLEEGTPRQPGEESMYDHYMLRREKQLQRQKERQKERQKQAAAMSSSSWSQGKPQNKGGK